VTRQRTVLVNIERMRQMDELLGEGWGAHPPGPGRGFSPRVDVYYARQGERDAVAVVTVDLAGVSSEAVSLEISGRVLVVSGKRPVRETEGRAYQQVEIPTGAFRRAIELGVDVEADAARATFEEGLLRVELPLRLPDRTSRTVPIESPGSTTE
jgi:HSP20 family protein